MIVSHSRRFIFVHVNKAGGTSMELALAPHLAWNDLILGSTELGQAMKGPYQRAFGLSEHSSLEEIAAVCGRELVRSYFSFALVRHPVARLVSMYNFVLAYMQAARRSTGWSRAELCERILRGEDADAWPFMSWRVTRAVAASDGFGGFIRAPEAHADRSFMAQAEQLQAADGRLGVSMAIRLEDLRPRLPALERRLGLRIELHHAHRTPCVALRPAEVALHDRRFIRDLHAADFLAFEYA